MKKIFVAGASGYLGYFICKELIERGSKVNAMARDASEEPAVSILKELGADVCFINFMENGSFSQIPSDCDAVISCLAANFKTAAMIAIASFLGIFSSTFKIRAALSRWALYAFTHDAVGNPHGTITVKDEFAEYLREKRG